jgi:hypothetical protein
VESRRSIEKERGLDMIGDAQAEGADHHQGEQEKEDPHAAHPGGRNDPAIGFR